MQEIDNIREFENWLLRPENPVAFQRLDLRTFESDLAKHKFPGSMFLGCIISNETAGHIVHTGGLVISDREDVSFPIHKARLYTVDELFKGFDPKNELGYKATWDYKIYDEYVNTGMDTPASISVSIARRLHDHSITDALYEAIENRKVVAIMGGHSMERSDPYYLKVARISRTLTKEGFLMVSGGGPGAMEATHLGAYFANRTETELENAIHSFKGRKSGSIPGKEYDDEDWLHRAWQIREQYPLTKGDIETCMSIGIPTWFYGHEPPAPFATHIAKYFANSVREDGLLSIAKHGVIFAPGSAGTTQEIFQDAAQNHYAPYNKTSVTKHVSPMILFGSGHWKGERPLWSFLEKVASGRPYGSLLGLTDSEEEIIQRIKDYNPQEYAFPKQETAIYQEKTRR